MRTTAIIGIMSLALALGGVVVGHLLLIPMLRGETALVDANLARALSQPLAMRCAEVVLAASVLLAAVARRWLPHRVGPTLALLAAGVAGIERLVLLPELHEAWARVDLVAMRPLARIEVAEQLTLIHQACMGAMIVLLTGIAALACLRPKA
ncbi:hypothetical protein G6O69_07185 [Pseudenhygromyxa sp. WMMC2535]|nr:hypothetical protein [Pseudenhygromyxa sp. WMMC2535]